MTAPSLRFSQNAIINAARALSLCTEDEMGGKCYGIAHTAMQYILMDDLKTFNDMVTLLHEIPPDELAEMIRRSQDKLHPTAHDRLITNIPAFLQTIVLYQHTSKFGELIGVGNKAQTQDAASVRSLIIPDKLSSAGGIRMVNEFSGVYSLDDLHVYFRTMGSHFDKHLSLSRHPIVIQLRNINHAIFVSYKPCSSVWTLVNADLGVGLQFTLEEIPLAVLYSFGYKQHDIAILSSQIFGTHQSREPLYHGIRGWQELQAVSALHVMSESRVQAEDKHQSTWLFAAVRNSDLTTVKGLLARGANPNQVTKAKGISLLQQAAALNEPGIVLELLRSGANPTHKSNKGGTALDNAAFWGNLEVATILVEYDKQVLQPLKTAIRKGHVPIVQLLAPYLDQKDLPSLLFDTIPFLSRQMIESLSHVRRFTPNLKYQTNSTCLLDLVESLPNAVRQRVNGFINTRLLQDDEFLISLGELVLLVGNDELITWLHEQRFNSNAILNEPWAAPTPDLIQSDMSPANRIYQEDLQVAELNRILRRQGQNHFQRGNSQRLWQRTNAVQSLADLIRRGSTLAQETMEHLQRDGIINTAIGPNNEASMASSSNDPGFARQRDVVSFQNAELFCNAGEEALMLYKKYHSGESTPETNRGKGAGWFSWFRHGTLGLDNATAFVNALNRAKYASNPGESICDLLCDFVQDTDVRLHRHSFASYVLDALKKSGLVILPEALDGIYNRTRVLAALQGMRNPMVSNIYSYNV
jgi:hypothetical protein